jgi:hypothetical protein
MCGFVFLVYNNLSFNIMSPNNQVQCPKCNSTQIVANKKGFSGKKAVAGALLTGGVGILAGTIGSNNIIITCLNCGHQFKPGEKPFAKKTTLVWDQQSSEYIQNPLSETSKNIKVWAALITLILFLLVFFIIYLAFSNPDSVTTNSPSTISKNKKDVPSDDLNNVTNPVIYELIKTEKDDQGNINRLTLYVKSAVGLKSLNAFLLRKYKAPSASTTFQIFYFDNKKIARRYIAALFDPNTSDNQVSRMSVHVIGKYESRSYDNYEDFYIGKDALDN